VSGREWTDDEIDLLFENYEDMTVRELSEKLNRPLRSVQSKCRQLWIKPKSAAKEYTMYRGDEIVASGTTREIAKKTGLTIGTVRTYASRGKRGKVTFVEI